MRAVNQRLCRLEHRLAPVQRDFLRYPRQHIRAFISSSVPEHCLAGSAAGSVDRASLTGTCTRTLTADGALIEVVDISGSRHRVSAAEVDAFIASFPVTRI